MVSDKVGGPALNAIRRPAAAAAPPRLRLSADDVSRQPRLKNATRLTTTKLKKADSGTSSRENRGRSVGDRPARCFARMGGMLERKLLHVSVLLCVAGTVGLCWPAVSQLRSMVGFSSAEASINPPVSRCLRFSRCHGKAEAGLVKHDPFSKSTYAPSKPRVMAKARTRPGREVHASTTGRAWSRLKKRSAQRGRAAAKYAASQPKPSPKPSVRLASLEGAPPSVAAAPPRISSAFGAFTSLEDFETAPFPYHGTDPTSGRPFLNAGTASHEGHVNFRGQVLWELKRSATTACFCTFPPVSIRTALR